MKLKILFKLLFFVQNSEASTRRFLRYETNLYGLDKRNVSTLNISGHSQVTCSAACMTRKSCDAFAYNATTNECMAGSLTLDGGNFKGYTTKGRYEFSPNITPLVNYSFVLELASTSRLGLVSAFDLSGKNRSCNRNFQPLPWSFSGLTLFIHGTILSCSGHRTPDQCFVLSPEHDSWEEIQGLKLNRLPAHGSAQSPNGELWMLIGDKTFELLDIKTMKRTRSGNCSAPMNGALITFVNATSVVSLPYRNQQTYIYHIDTDSWRRMKDRRYIRYNGFFGKVTLKNGTEALVSQGHLTSGHRTEIMLLEGNIGDKAWTSLDYFPFDFPNSAHTLKYGDTILGFPDANSPTPGVLPPVLFNVDTLQWEAWNVSFDLHSNADYVPVTDEFCGH